ncbi:MAG: ATP-dependent protease LonB [Nanoarchaeota archaeon]
MDNKTNTKLKKRELNKDLKTVNSQKKANNTKKESKNTTITKDSDFNFTTTKDITVDKEIVNQVVGQENACKVIKKAAKKRRHVFLIGEPGTGKSMLGLALAELMPKEKLVDIVSFNNPNDENNPLIRTLTAGKGREFVARSKFQTGGLFKGQTLLLIFILLLAFIGPIWAFRYYTAEYSAVVGAIIFAALSVGSIFFIAAIIFIMNFGSRLAKVDKSNSPKLIVDNFSKIQAPYLDATGAHAGALLGDVLHDPFQSGGLGTPAHERVVAGMIHKAHMGVLFIDEVSTLKPHTQQELLTALQEGKYSITGQSERSAGAMVRTEPVPCNFVLVIAGNLETLKHMHPALRSRIRGYGYEVYMDETMLDNNENRMKIARFVAQEVNKDKTIPHFTKNAVLEIIEEAKRMANRKGHLTLRLRELGGIVRAAGDIASEEESEFVRTHHIPIAKKIAKTLEKQIADKHIERKKEYEVIKISGQKIGRVNGLAVLGGSNSFSGIILPIESQITPGGKEQQIIATGKLGEIAKEAVTNVSAIIKKYFGLDIKEKHDIYLQFLQTYEGVEGDSASIAIAVAIISALKKLPIKQDYAMTGSLSVRGEVLPVGGVSSKVEAAINTGIKNVIVPHSNLKDIIIKKEKLKLINIIPVNKIAEVLEHAIDWTGNEDILNSIKKNK